VVRYGGYVDAWNVEDEKSLMTLLLQSNDIVCIMKVDVAREGNTKGDANAISAYKTIFDGIIQAWSGCPVIKSHLDLLGRSSIILIFSDF
jgi:hypothetical protein